jgi:phage/plasmid-like protein (TIGR03299 family)
MATVISERHNVSEINVGGGQGSDPVQDLRDQISRLYSNGSWDDAEYGISRAAQIAKLEEALKFAESPEGQEQSRQAAEKALAEMRQRAIRRAGLDTSNGRVNVMVAGEEAWHGLGVRVAEAVTSGEAIRLAGLDWAVQLWDSPAYNPETGETVADPTRRKVVRADTKVVLGTVGTNWQPFQNAEAFEFMDSLVGAEVTRYESAGSLNGGRNVFMLGRIPKQYFVGQDDEILPYVLLCNGHDGSMALRMLPTTVRVVCNNTLNLSLRSGTKEHALCIRHSQSLKGKVETARQNLGLIGKRLDRFQEQAQALAAVSLKETEVTEYVEQFFPRKIRPVTGTNGDGAALLNGILERTAGGSELVSDLIAGHFAETERIAARNARILEQIMDNFEADPARGTAWGAYNAVSEYADHQKTARGKTEAERRENRLESNWFGSSDAMKQEAFGKAMSLLNR